MLFRSWRDGDDLAVDVDDDHVGGGWSPPEVDSSGVPPPPDLLQRQPSISLFLVSLLWRLSSGKTSGDLLYSRF